MNFTPLEVSKSLVLYLLLSDAQFNQQLVEVDLSNGHFPAHTNTVNVLTQHK